MTTQYPARRSIRLPNYDYTWPGAYFITIVTYQRALLFDDEPVRTIVVETWQTIPQHFHNVSLDTFVIMPNHLHGIIVIGAAGAKPALSEACPEESRRVEEVSSPRRLTH